MSEKSQNKSEFIRKYPHLDVAEVVAEGARQGLEIKESLVYNVRSKAKQNGEVTKPAKKAKATKPVKEATVVRQTRGTGPCSVTLSFKSPAALQAALARL